MERVTIYGNKPWLRQYENGVPYEISFENNLLPGFLCCLLLRDYKDRGIVVMNNPLYHPSRGEAAKVFAVLKDGKNMELLDLIDYCSNKLAKYNLPARVEPRDSLPKSTVGKISKRELKAEEACL